MQLVGINAQDLRKENLRSEKLENNHWKVKRFDEEVFKTKNGGHQIQRLDNPKARIRAS